MADDPWAAFADVPAATAPVAALPAANDPWAAFQDAPAPAGANAAPAPDASSAPPLTIQGPGNTPAPDSFDPEGTGAGNYDPNAQMPGNAPTPGDPGVMQHVLNAASRVPQNLSDKLNNMADGIPFADRARAAVQAATGVGGAFGDYSGNLVADHAAQAQRMQDNPASAIMGQVTGGMGPMLLGGGPVAAAETTLGKVFGGAALGTGLGTVGGVSASPDLTDLKQTAVSAGKGALIGGGTGFAAPLVGASAGAAYRGLFGPAVPTVTGPNGIIGRQAQKYVMDAIQSDGPGAVRQGIDQLGDQGMLADYGPSLRGVAQGLVTKPGPQQSAIINPLTARNLGTNDRLNAVVDHSLGPAQSPQAYTNDLAAQRSALHAQLPDIYANAPQVDVSPVLSDISKQIQPAVGQQESVLKSAQNWISNPTAATPEVAATPAQRIPVTDPKTGNVIRYQNVPATPGTPAVPAAREPITDPVTLGNAKSELDGLITYGNPTLGVTPGGVSKAQGAAANIRGGINETLRSQVPGYSDVMDQSSALARQMEAVENGGKSLGSGPTALRPDDFANQYGSMSPQEQTAYRVGMRGTVDAALGTRANDLVALKGVTQGDNGWNGQKLATAYGQDSTDALNNAVDQESAYRNTFNKITQNSETARNTASAKALADAKYEPYQIHERPDITWEGAAYTAAVKPINALLRALQPQVDNAARDAQIADAVTAQGQSRNLMLAQMLRAHSVGQANATLGTSAANAGTVLTAASPAALVAALRAHRSNGQ